MHLKNLLKTIINMLNLKQQRFIEHYLITGNATQAALDSGYSKHTAAKIGSENLQKPQIKDEIQRRQAETAKELSVTKESLIQDLIEIKNNTKKTNPSTALKAIEIINRMLGFEAPKQITNTIVGEQPLFGPNTSI
jgi:phage terminase small subunit